MLRQMLIIGFALLACGSAIAHDLPVSELRLVAGDGRLHLEIMLNAWELQLFNELDVDRNGLVDRRELGGREEEIARQVVGSLDIRVDGKLVEAEVAGIVPDYNTHHVTIRAHYPVDCQEDTVEVSSRLAAITNSAHVVKLALQRPGATERATLSGSDSVARFSGERRDRPEESGVSKKDHSTADIVRPWSQRQVGVGLVVALALGCVLLVIGRRSTKDHP